ncbi:MAG: tRNA (adenosine(37)-N6)-threonylcarbamoyltransferase complex dimerization subunit type 1 TsaB, partial [Bacteroidia bacterium]|nr:tRNA (adenosine(37)-N6)-threonylcarbamoyltransferase complex dimerization subunit type 1 TsaB [Bacteroidia bacterium]
DNSTSYSHAERLHVYIEQVMSQAKLDMHHLDAIAVSMGPGSYTGLRIGVSAAKGLCFALNIPLYAISTLKSLARKADTDADFVIPLIDARRMEVYSAIYDGEMNEIREIRAEILVKDSFQEQLQSGKVEFIGNGVEKFQKICDHANAIFKSEQLPSAAQMAILVEEKHKKSDTVDVAYFEPFYLKDFISG